MFYSLFTYPFQRNLSFHNLFHGSQDLFSRAHLTHNKIFSLEVFTASLHEFKMLNGEIKRLTAPLTLNTIKLFTPYFDMVAVFLNWNTVNRTDEST